MNQTRKTSVSSVRQKADPSSLIPLWWEQHLTVFWTLTLTREKGAHGKMPGWTLLPLPPLNSCCCVSFSFIYSVVLMQWLNQNVRCLESRQQTGSRKWLIIKTTWKCDKKFCLAPQMVHFRTHSPYLLYFSYKRCPDCEHSRTLSS